LCKEFIMQHCGSRRTAWLGLALFATLGLAACGVTSTTGGAGTTATSPTATSKPTSTGCPLPNQMISRAPANVTVRPVSEGVKPVSITVGQIIEVQLPFGHRWALFPPGSSDLTVQSPAGYGDASVQSCIWRFQGAQAGSETLIFEEQPLCQSGMECPNYVTQIQIPVTVGS
jgi:hypothetical protein